VARVPVFRGKTEDFWVGSGKTKPDLEGLLRYMYSTLISKNFSTKNTQFTASQKEREISWNGPISSRSPLKRQMNFEMKIIK